MAKIQSTVEPTERNSVKSNLELKPIVIEPVDVRSRLMPIGEMMKHWNNFNLDHYEKISILRATIG